MRGTQIVAEWPSARIIHAKQAPSVCRVLGASTSSACAHNSRRLLVVHLKDVTSSLFAQLPRAIHVLDPIDKIYRGWSQPSDRRLCGLITHSDAQAALYLAKTAARAAWVVPDHGLSHCQASPDPAAAASLSRGGAASAASRTDQRDERAVFARRTVLVLGGAPSAALRAALASWAAAARRRVRVLFERDLRANVSFSASAGWEAWLCGLLRHDASVAVAWDQISGLAYERDCHDHMGLRRDECMSLKPAERFIVPTSVGVPTIGYPLPSFLAAARTADDPDAAEHALLADALTSLVARLTVLTHNLSEWRRARAHGTRIGEVHSMRAVVGAYQRARAAAIRRCDVV